MKWGFQPNRTAAKGLYGALAFASVIAVLPGCGEESSQVGDREDAPGPLGQVIQPIIGGTNSGAENDSVVVLATFVGGSRATFCSATLVAPNLLLTARHCVSDIDGPAGCLANGQPDNGTTTIWDRAPASLAIFTQKDGKAPDTNVESNAVARGAKLIVDPPSPTCNNDLALLVIDKELPIAPASIRLGAPIANELLTAVGFGVLADGKLPTARQVRKDVLLAGVGPGQYPANEVYGYGASEFVTGEGACAGDSGGPAFAKSGAVVGVASRTNNGRAADSANFAATCVGEETNVVYSQLAAHADLIQRAFAEAGKSPILEQLPAPPAAAAKAPEATVVATKSGQAKGPVPNVTTPQGDAGGCSFSPTTPGDTENVGIAAGFIALLASLVGLRRRFRRGRPAEDRAPFASRATFPSMP